MVALLSIQTTSRRLQATKRTIGTLLDPRPLTLSARESFARASTDRPIFPPVNSVAKLSDHVRTRPRTSRDAILSGYLTLSRTDV